MVALALGCDDGGGSFDTPASMGRDNGASCFFSGAGADICGGRLCVGFAGDDLGLCSEPCTDACRRGGICGATPLGERVCLVRCVDDGDCGDEFISCQPALEGMLLCPALNCEPAPEGIRFCLPRDLRARDASVNP